MFGNIRELPDKRLISLQDKYLEAIRQKEEVLARHAPGTPYHTRAQRDISGYQSRLDQVNEELQRRNRERNKKRV
jgi:hypothetical protein